MADGGVSVPAGASGSVSRDFASEFAGLRPFMDEDERATKEERLRQKLQEIRRSREAERRRRDSDPDAKLAAKQETWRQTLQEIARGREHRALELEAEKRILDYDPKQGGAYYSRLYYVHDLTTFDHDEESPLGPMRYTDRVCKPGEKPYQLCEAVNILSVKIASSDVGFPIRVYGTVIARDSIDRKCVYLFDQDSDHCQLINSEDESLILTGPKRGLALISDTYVETNLKIKGHQGQEDRELSKGILAIEGIAHRVLTKCELESCSLATRLSTVDVVYAVVKSAVEGTIAIEVVRGDFDGEITAHTTSIQKSLVLYDSKVAGAMTGDGRRVIQLLRSVVSVYLKEMLFLTFVSRDGKTKRIIEFTPRVNGGEKDEITVGATDMSVKVTWSIIDY